MAAVEPTEITAGRLHLRPWSAADADTLQDALTDPAVVRWTGLPSRPALEWVTRTYPGRWADGTGAGFAVLDATTGELLGGVDLHGVDTADVRVGVFERVGLRHPEPGLGKVKSDEFAHGGLVLDDQNLCAHPRLSPLMRAF